MSNTIPLKEKLDFQQYQLVINALANIGIEVAIPNEDSLHQPLSQENNLSTPLGENEQIFKLQYPLEEPYYLTDKHGKNMVILSKEAYDKLLDKEQKLEILKRSLSDRELEIETLKKILLSKEQEVEKLKSSPQLPTWDNNPVSTQSFSEPVAHQNIAEPIVHQSITEPIAPQNVSKEVVFEQTSSYSESPLVQQTVRTTFPPVSSQDAIEKARSILEKYKK